MQGIELTDLIDVQVLQRLQDEFSKFTGMAALITDAKGRPITQGSGFTDFCFRLVRESEKGFRRCTECDRQGAIKTLQEGKPVVYSCHAGLVDFAAPVMVEGNFIGCFIGGQVITDSIDEEQFRKMAQELEVDPELYMEYARKVNLVEREQVERAAEFLSGLAEVFSQMAYANYLALEQSKQFEQAAHSRNRFIMDMHVSMKQNAVKWIEIAERLKDAEGEERSRILELLMKKGEEFLITLDDMVDLSQIADGEIQLAEEEYGIRDLMHLVIHSVREEMKMSGNQVDVVYSDTVPEVVMGDAGRLRQILIKLLRVTNQNVENGQISVLVEGRTRSYATDLTIRIRVYDKELTEDRVFALEKELQTSILPVLIARLSGTVTVEYEPGESASAVVCIPQLTVRK